MKRIRVPMHSAIQRGKKMMQIPNVYCDRFCQTFLNICCRSSIVYSVHKWHSTIFQICQIWKRSDKLAEKLKQCGGTLEICKRYRAEFYHVGKFPQRVISLRYYNYMRNHQKRPALIRYYTSHHHTKNVECVHNKGCLRALTGPPPYADAMIISLKTDSALKITRCYFAVMHNALKQYRSK